ncbi:ribonuclease H-like domain, reverse transcriptase, RNA-dependent DNA polymerase [Tanacetum coccineum]
MPVININELYHMEDAYGGASWNPWSLGCDRTGLSRRQEEQHCERFVVSINSRRPSSLNRTEYSNMNNDSRRGRGRSSYSRERGRGRGRGRGQGSGRGNTQNHGQRDSSKNHEDHERKGKQQEPCNYSYFSELNENITSRVRFGDGLCVSIKGKGHDFVPRRVESDQTWEYAANPKVAGQYQPTASQGSNLLHDVNSPIYMISPEREQAVSGIDDTPIPVAQLKTIRLLIALTAGKGWKIHHLDAKTTFLHGDLKEEVKTPSAWNIKLDRTLKEMGFQQCVQEKAVDRKVPNGEFIIVAVYVDDVFMTVTSLELINEFKKRLTSCIKGSQEKDCVKIKKERYALKILKEAGMEDCNATLCPMESGLKL